MSSNHRPRIFDLYCGAGGAAVGYDRAGWEVVGFDIAPQSNYPFEFHLADAIDVLESIRDGGHWYYEVGEPDAFHASPPCQAYGAATNRLVTRDAPRLIEPTRSLLNCFPEIPYVIENVVGAPLSNPVTLCGSSFDLAVKRHRLFESDVFLFGLPCQHPTEKKYPTHARKDKAQLSPFVHLWHGRRCRQGHKPLAVGDGRALDADQGRDRRGDSSCVHRMDWSSGHAARPNEGSGVSNQMQGSAQ